MSMSLNQEKNFPKAINSGVNELSKMTKVKPVKIWDQNIQVLLNQLMKRRTSTHQMETSSSSRVIIAPTWFSRLSSMWGSVFYQNQIILWVLFEKKMRNSRLLALICKKKKKKKLLVVQTYFLTAYC